MNSVTAEKLNKNPFYIPNEDQQYQIQKHIDKKEKVVEYGELPLHDTSIPVEVKPKRRGRKAKNE